MAVISTYINNESANSSANMVAFDYHFENVAFVEIPKSVHNKETILHAQLYDENNEMLYHPIKITEDMTVIADFSIECFGMIKII